MSTVVLPTEVGLRLRRRDGAARWRLDHGADADRDRLWRAYVTGALWGERLDRFARRAVMAGLGDAERVVPWTLNDLDADPDPQPLPGGVAVEPHEVELVDGVGRGLHPPHGPVAADSDSPLIGAGDERLRDRVEQHFPIGH